jgi:hypothetical protein
VPAWIIDSPQTVDAVLENHAGDQEAQQQSAGDTLVPSALVEHALR